MGLFDIFKRKAKKETEATQPDATPTDEQATPAAAEPASTAPEAVVTDEEQATPATEVMDTVATDETAAEAEPIATPADADSEEPAAVEASVATDAEANDEAPAEEVDVAAAEEPTPTPAAATVDNPAPAAEVESVSAESAPDAVEPTVTTPADEADETDEADEASVETKYEHGLAKSRSGFGDRLNRFLARFRSVDEDFFDDLEELMIESDVGYEMAVKLSDSLRDEVKLQNAKSSQEVSNVIIEKMVELYEAAGENEQVALATAPTGPTVIMFVGVNGAGKTTTIGKLAARYKQVGKKVLLAAGDTFRAGAAEQLDVWAKRDGVDIVTGPENGDPAAVVFDAVKQAKADNYDILLVDTAGRLQNKVNLMNELAKMKRILTREIPDAPHEVLLVLDATTGQNALNQAKIFNDSTDVTGIVLTKLDGTARGGIVLAIRNELHIPVKLVGLGEQVSDLADFDASDFVYGLFKGLVKVD
ncbi:MAG: signal recognition particle-docking protein FtsY [Limosilactobacillus sp.]|nr:signal recognition particle-docking protein FtsY [Limosilactobacillus sp.]